MRIYILVPKCISAVNLLKISLILRYRVNNEIDEHMDIPMHERTGNIMPPAKLHGVEASKYNQLYTNFQHYFNM